MTTTLAQMQKSLKTYYTATFIRLFAPSSVAHSVGGAATTFFLVVRRFFFAGSVSTGTGIAFSTEVMLCSLFDARCYRCF